MGSFIALVYGLPFRLRHSTEVRIPTSYVFSDASIQSSTKYQWAPYFFDLGISIPISSINKYLSSEYAHGTLRGIQKTVIQSRASEFPQQWGDKTLIVMIMIVTIMIHNM